jgi:hypothetical protein
MCQLKQHRHTDFGKISDTILSTKKFMRRSVENSKKKIYAYEVIQSVSSCQKSEIKAKTG